MCSVMLSNISEMFAHSFTKCAFSVAYELFLAYLAGDIVYNIVWFTWATSDGVVIVSSDGASNSARIV